MRTILNFPFLLLCILSYNISFGADIKWIGGVGDWDVAANWEGGVVPGINDEAQIETAGDTVTIPNGLNIEVFKIDIFGGAFLKNFGTINTGGSLFSDIVVFIGTFENEGTIIVTEDGDPSFSCISVGGAGLFVNRGTILLNLEIPDSDSHSSGIRNVGRFINEEGGEITINDPGPFGIESDLNTATNFFINRGVITINRPLSHGMRLNRGANENSGVITINDGQAEDNNVFGVLSIDGFNTTFTNTGQIIFNDPDFPVIINSLDDGGFVNSGGIEINVQNRQWVPYNSPFSGDLIINNGLFTNTSEGSIDILIAGGCNGGPFALQNQADFLNEGEFKVIFTSGGSCAGISNKDNFNNTGEIVINVDDGEFVNGDLLSNTGVNAVFDNNGTLNLDNLNGGGFGFGLFNGQGAVFNNFSSLEATGINNFGTRSVLVNNGSILSTSAISNSGQFENMTDGTIELEQVVSNRFISLTNGEFSTDFDEDEVGFFTNDGDIFIRGNQTFTSGSNGIRSNIGSTFINNGTVEMTNLHFTGISIGFAANDQPPVFINNGFLTVAGVNGNGMDISSGSFVNNNSLHIMNCDQSAIRSPGSAEFTNAGVIEIDGNIGNDALIISGTGFVNDLNGSIIIKSATKSGGFFSFGSAILLQGQLTNRGSIRIENDIQGPGIKIRVTNNSFNNEAGGEIFINDTGEEGINIERGEFNNSGKITFGSNIASEVIIGPKPFNNLPEGELWGIGTIDGSSFTNQGSLNPGFSPGIFEITDLYDHTEGMLNLEIAGTDGPGSDTGHDLIQVADSVILGGTCNISFIDDFEPQVGDSFILMTSTDVILGEFDTVNLDRDTASWEIIYSTNEVILSIFNIPPVFTSSPTETTLEDELYEYDITATDQNDQNSLSITTTSLPTWLELIDNGSGNALLTGTPENDDVGEYEINLQVQDGFGATDLQTFTLTVENVNDAPVFISEPVDSVDENESYLYEIIAEDVDVGDELEIIPVLIPVWLDFNDDGDGTASLTGTAPGDGPDEYEVLLIVYDLDGETAIQSFTITIIRENRTPEFTSTPVETATEDALYTYSITGSDADGNDGLTISADNLPSWLQLVDNGGGTATLSGTPTDNDVGTANVTLILTDPIGANDEQAFTITIFNTNDPPVFTSTPVLEVEEDVLYVYEITTTDVDEGDVLAITASALPGWLTLTDNGDGTATLSGTPSNNEIGSHQVVLLVSDLENTSDEQSFTIEVNSDNEAPAFLSIPIATAIEDELYLYTLEVADPDPGDVLTITSSDLPVWLSLENDSHGFTNLTGTPTNDDVGTYQISLKVTDSKNAEATQAFILEVINTNDPPEFTSLPVLETRPGADYSYEISATDPDVDDNLTITADLLPDWLILTDNGNGNATLSGQVPFNLEGEETVILRVEDQEKESDKQEFEIIIRSEESIVLQTALTPNGDGLNDTWRIEPIIGCQECRVQIFNRWGEEIFLSVGYEQEWDGTFGSTELPSGTYYYVIDTNDGQDPMTGTITILK